ncbi:glutaminyl-peptide cyclotransferase [Evansella sp. AB-rgal1]|uniref:glutaminyl-peptide cyclotransferase n=1 Tax=Evansella sp. AB-rgal1 TaxID=3242696 RepID=UPI00359D2F01
MKNKFILFLLITMLVIGGTVIYIQQDRNLVLGAPVFYVANAGDGTISKVDLEKPEPVVSIPLNTTQLSHGIAIMPDEKIVYYGTGFQGKSVRALDVNTEKTIFEITFDQGVHGIDIHPSGEYLYVSLMAGLGQEGGVLAVINTKNFEEIARITTDDGPAHVSITNDGYQIWVANVNANTISVVDAYTFQVLATIPVGEVPNEVAVSPLLDYAYSANVRSNSISVIDMETYKVVKEIEVGAGVHGVTVTPDGKQVWTANNQSNDVTVIDVETLTVVETIKTGSYANHISFSPNGDLAFVTHRESNNLVVISATDYSVIDEMDLGMEPHELTLKGMLANTGMGENDKDQNADKDEFLYKGESFAEGVEIKVQLLSPYSTKNQELLRELGNVTIFDTFSFLIDMTTHYGDLMSLPFKERIVLQNNDGFEVEAVKWVLVNEDSHHPKFIGIFDKTINKSPLLINDNSNFKLVFRPFINEEEVSVELYQY